jgi:hypothetical protein
LFPPTGTFFVFSQVDNWVDNFGDGDRR